MTRERDISAMTAMIAVLRGRMTPQEWGREEVAGLLAAGLVAAGVRPPRDPDELRAPVRDMADLLARRLGKATGSDR